jgi:PAS domain S-box-containing protein
MATNEDRINVLLVEDSPSDAQLLCEFLQDYPPQRFAMARAERLEEAIKLVAERTFDVVLLDLTLPDSAGLDTCTRMRRAAPHVPIVVLTGVDDETIALEAMRQGVEDYLVKGQIIHGGTIGRTIRYAVERSRSERALRESEQRYHTLFSTMSEGFALHEILCDGDGRPCDYRFLDVNLAFERQTGLKAADLVGRTVRKVLPDLEPLWIERYGRVALTGQPDQFEARSSALGRWYDVRAYQTVPGRFAVVFMDITARRQVEAVQSFLAQSAGASDHEDFFRTLARYLAETLAADFVCIDRLVEDGLSAQTVAVYYDGKFEDDLTYTLKDTPCGEVVGRTVCCFPRGVRGLFPGDAVLQEMKAEGYVGITLWGHQGEPIGLIALIWRCPLEDPSPAESLLQLVAARAAGELERERAEAALRESEERLERSQEIAHLGSWELDLIHDRLTWSDEVYRIFGLTPQEFGATYQAFLERVHPDDRAVVDAAYSASLRESRDTYEMEHRVVRHSTGEIRIVHEKCEHFRDGSGRIVRSVGMVHDVTERHQMEDQLRRLNDQLEEKVQAQTEELRDTIDRLEEEVERRVFAEGELRKHAQMLEASFHELEHRARQLQKLTLELSQAEDRERKRLAEILHDDLQQILTASTFHLHILRSRLKNNKTLQDIAEHVHQLLKEAIDTSRSLSHELSPAVLYRNDLGTTFEWLAQQVQAKHGLTVHVEVRDHVDSPSDAHKAFLFRAAQEILFNIVKHAEVKEARVRLQRMREQVWLTIGDQGQGFDPQSLDKTAGFGLLSIRERVELLGGRMKIRSAKGKDSTFLIAVPDAEAADTPRACAERQVHSRVATRKPAPQAGERVLRVLLVDDHQIVREGLAALLGEQQDMEIVGQAGDGREALDLVSLLEPDVVVMDATMPGMAGDEATRQIKLHQPKTRIVALSMLEEAQVAETMREAGAEVYLVKTATLEQLLAAIRGRPSSSL